MSIYTKLAKVQKDLKAPKNQFNSFGKYKYRSCEDILEGLKAVLGDLVVTISDDVEMVGDRIYIKATVTVTDGKESVCNSAFARESLAKKGMDDSQITGTASSYARKYALNGMFLIDDTKDADSMDNSNQASKPAAKADHRTVIARYNACKDQAARDGVWNNITPEEQKAINEALS